MEYPSLVKCCLTMLMLMRVRARENWMTHCLMTWRYCWTRVKVMLPEMVMMRKSMLTVWVVLGTTYVLMKWSDYLIHPGWLGSDEAWLAVTSEFDVSLMKVWVEDEVMGQMMTKLVIGVQMPAVVVR